MNCKIIAHRGANKKAPQNTMPAFRLALQENADGFETDVHLTKDGVPVICHNNTIDDTSDGRGAIGDYTLAELRRFDFGASFGEEFAGTSAPTLEEFLTLAKGAGLDPINIELKSPRQRKEELVHTTLEMVKAFEVTPRVIVSSFDPRILKQVKEELPECRTGLLYPCNDLRISGPMLSPLFCAGKIGADYIHPAYFFVNRALVTVAHALGLGVNVWTVDTVRATAFLLRCGVDGIITNCPAEVRAYAEAAERSPSPEPPLFAHAKE